MKIGYPCINLTLNCRSSRTFRLRNYSEERLIQTVSNNLDCLSKILQFNVNNKILFFRITSDLIPFASHPIMEYDWQNHFKAKFKAIGNFIKKNDIRITMHPGQYTVLNSPRERVYQNSLKELYYHTDIIDLLELDNSAKIITHVGGIYNDKQNSIKRFIKRYDSLEERVKKYYVIENDDKSYHVRDCLVINEKTGIPIIFDLYHHECYNTNETAQDVIEKVFQTWKSGDGLPIVHYSSENLIKGKYSHAESIDIQHFKTFIESTLNYNFDIMIEIKNKEISTLQAIEVIKNIRY